MIDLKQYQNTLEKINATAKTKLKSYDPILPFIMEEVKKSQTLIDNLRVKNKKKGHIEMLAGSPDRRDIIQEKINGVLTNNNNQVILNRAIIKKINNITQVTNSITNSLKYEGNET